MTGEAGLVNVANVLTMVRIILIPVFVGCLLAGGTAWWLAALATFCVASLTDLLDGRLARSRGLVTDFGKIADPVVAICLYVLPGTLSPRRIVRALVMAAAVVVTLVTGIDHVLQAMRLHRSEPAAG